KAMIERFGEDVPPHVANLMAWALVLGPGAMPDPQVALRLARRGVAARPISIRLKTLGGALFRAGPGAEAVRGLFEAVRGAGGGRDPLCWAAAGAARRTAGTPRGGSGLAGPSPGLGRPAAPSSGGGRRCPSPKAAGPGAPRRGGDPPQPGRTVGANPGRR